jgi:hypothetical protein
MRTFADAQTGEELAAVYVPTALNPTSGFLEIVPMAKLTASDIDRPGDDDDHLQRRGDAGPLYDGVRIPTRSC